MKDHMEPYVKNKAGICTRIKTIVRPLNCSLKMKDASAT